MAQVEPWSLPAGEPKMCLRTATPGVPPAVNLRAILERSAKWKAVATDLNFETAKVEGEVRQTLDVSWEKPLKRVCGPAANPAPPAVVVVVVVVDVEANMAGEGEQFT